MNALYLVACAALVLSYMCVGKVFWGLVKARMGDTIQASVIFEQERQGHMSALLPKFGVIFLWPLVGLIATAAWVKEALRTEAPSV